MRDLGYIEGRNLLIEAMPGARRIAAYVCATLSMESTGGGGAPHL